MECIKGVFLCAYLVLFVCSVYVAPARSEIYVSGNAGVMTLSDFDYTNDVFVGSYNGCINNSGSSFSTIKGSAKTSYEFHSGYSFSGAVGAKLYNTFRVEFEIGYTKNDFKIDFDFDFPDSALGNYYLGAYDSFYNDSFVDHYCLKGEIEIWTYLCNCYYDFKITPKLNPFIGVGLGFADARLKFTNAADAYGFDTIDETAFAYQVMAGISYAISEKINIDLQYRYLDIDEDDFLDSHFDFEYQGAMIGLRVTL